MVGAGDEAVAGSKAATDDGKGNRLQSDNDAERSDEERIDVERDGTKPGRTRQQNSANQQADAQQGCAGIEKQPARGKQQQEAQMAPAIAERTQMRRPRAAVLAQGGWHFANIELGERGLDHHFGGELHPHGAQLEVLHGLAGKAAQTAMKVPYVGAEQQATDEAQHRIADIAVVPWHGAGRDAAGKAIAHHQIGTIAQFGNERVKAREVIAVIGVAHDDIGAIGCGDAGRKGRAIATLLDSDDPRAMGLGDALRPIGRAVIGNQHFP